MTQTPTIAQWYCPRLIHGRLKVRVLLVGLHMRKNKCHGKIRYYSRPAAWKASLLYYKKLYSVSHPYRCWNCNKFHLTTQSYAFVPKYQIENFAKAKEELLKKEWDIFKKILNVKTNNEKKREKKRFYKQTFKPSPLSLWWLKIRNRYFRWLDV